MLGEERVVVYDQPGTTRDSIYIPFERDDEKYTFIDTAGVRKRGKIHEEVEKFSVVKTLQAIKDANVVIFVMDAREGVVDHDLNLLGFALEAGRAIVIALNKWDGMEPSEREYVKTELERRLFFVDFADIHFISALHGTGVGHLYKSVQAAFKSAVTRWPTSRLTQILEDAISEHQPPMVNGRRIKLRYAHLGGANPPLIVIHGNQTDKIPRSYSRYGKHLPPGAQAGRHADPYRVQGQRQPVRGQEEHPHRSSGQQEAPPDVAPQESREEAQGQAQVSGELQASSLKREQCTESALLAA